MLYKQVSVTGQSYVRSYRVVVENKKDEVPSATFLEEESVLINGVERLQPVGQTTMYFNPTDTFPLINPLNGQLLGNSASHLDLQILLYSLYMDAASKRDAAAIAEAERLALEAAAQAAAYEAREIAEAERQAALAASAAAQVQRIEDEQARLAAALESQRAAAELALQRLSGVGATQSPDQTP